MVRHYKIYKSMISVALRRRAVRPLQTACKVRFSTSTRLLNDINHNSSAEEIAASFKTKAESLSGFDTRWLAVNDQVVSMKATLAPYLPKMKGDANAAPTIDKLGFARSPPMEPGLQFLLFSNTRLHTEESMGQDGSDTQFNPPGPYNRRMWAGGDFEFNLTQLNYQKHFREYTKIENVEAKKRSNGEDMIVVTVKKYVHAYGKDFSQPFYNETRQWVFLKEPSESPRTASTAQSKGIDKLPDPEISHTVKFTRNALFRFSVLTFNGHRIHLDPEYARAEGHSDVLVHGPLILTLIMYTWRACREQDPNLQEQVLHTVSYRAMEKLTVNEEVSFRANYKAGVAWAEKKDENGNRVLVMMAKLRDRKGGRYEQDHQPYLDALSLVTNAISK